jgi:hypothetical protein
VLGTLGPDAPCNIDDLLLRESMDIIGVRAIQTLQNNKHAAWLTICSYVM